MDLRFSRDAMTDLDQLKEWLKPLSRDGYARVVGRLTVAIRKLNDHPNAGRGTSNADVRELVDPRYGFIIPYTIRDDTIWILRIYNARRYPLNYDEPQDPVAD
jgi:toxin ParE1/3/4